MSATGVPIVQRRKPRFRMLIAEPSMKFCHWRNLILGSNVRHLWKPVPVCTTPTFAVPFPRRCDTESTILVLVFVYENLPIEIKYFEKEMMWTDAV